VKKVMDIIPNEIPGISEQNRVYIALADAT
jgi:hypothetical protein